MKTQGEQAPRLGGIQAGPVLAGVLYALLVGSAALALWVREFPGALPVRLEQTAPYVFLAFLVCFAVYRLVLVRARKYSAFKAFFQIGAAAIFFMLLLPGARGTYMEEEDDDLLLLIQDANPTVRAAAAELARHRSNAAVYGASLARALRDPDPKVRTQAHRSLVAITGEDLGGPDQEGAKEAWEKRFP